MPTRKFGRNGPGKSPVLRYDRRADPCQNLHHDCKPRPHPHHPCRQLAAQRSAERALVRREAGESFDKGQFEARDGGEPLRHVVAKQAAAGIDIGNDGEQRVGFQTYVPQRMSGFGGDPSGGADASSRNFPNWWNISRAAFRM